MSHNLFAGGRSSFQFVKNATSVKIDKVKSNKMSYAYISSISLLIKFIFLLIPLSIFIRFIVLVLKSLFMNSMILSFLVLSLDYFLFWLWVIFLCFFEGLVYFNWNFEFCFIYYWILLYSFEDFFFPDIQLRYLWIMMVLLRLDF